MKVRMWTKRAIPVVALVALVSQSAISYAGLGTKNQTTTTTDTVALSDSLAVDQTVIVDQNTKGYGVAALNAYDAAQTRLTLGVTGGEGCNNSSAGSTGPIITFDGVLHGRDVHAKLHGQTSAKIGAGQEAAYWAGSTDLTVGLDMSKTEFHKQGVYADGVGGNPHIYVRIQNSAGGYDGPNEGWVYMGRCVQGTRYAADLLLNLPGRRHLRAATSSCSQTASSVSLRMRGGPKLKGDVAFTNQKVDDPTYSIHNDTSGNFEGATIAVTLGAGVQSNQWTQLKWQGGNPNFGVSFETSVPDLINGGYQYTTPILLGRCKAMIGTLPTDITVDQI